MNYRFNKQLGPCVMLCRLTILLGLMIGVEAVGASDLPDAVQIHGFASQSFIYTSDNNFFGDTDDEGDFDYTELGLNVSAGLNSNLQVAAQALSRRAGEGDNGDLRLDYALIDYTAHASPASRWGVRAGRVLNPLGIYNETRDMPFTRPTILLPQSIYFDRSRDLALSSDGVTAYGEYRWGRHELFWQVGAAEPRVDGDELERALLSSLQQGSFEPDISYLGRLIWETDGGRTRLALSSSTVNIDYEPGAADFLPAGSIEFRPTIVSAQYNAEKWSITSEYAQRRFQYAGFVPSLVQTFTGESAYLQGVYRISARWDVLARYDVLYTDKDDRSGKRFETQRGMPAHTRFAKDFTVGLGWNITPSILIRAEYHDVKGTAWLPAADNLASNRIDPAATDEDWELFALQASFRF